MLNLLHYRSWGREGFGLGYSSRDSWMRVPSLCPGVQGTSWIEPIWTASPGETYRGYSVARWRCYSMQELKMSDNFQT